MGDGDLNPGDRVWVGQMERKQTAAESGTDVGRRSVKLVYRASGGKAVVDSCFSNFSAGGCVVAGAMVIPAGKGFRGGRSAVGALKGNRAAAGASTAIVASDGTRISGITKHGIDRVVGGGVKRVGVKPQALLDALKHPTKITNGVDRRGRPYTVYTGADARVVVNPETGRIVSVNPLSRARGHK